MTDWYCLWYKLVVGECLMSLVLCYQVSLFNYVFLVSWAFALPFSQFRPMASSVCTVWTCVIIVCKMLYQLTSIQPATYSKNCSMVRYKSPTQIHTHKLSWWSVKPLLKIKVKQLWKKSKMVGGLSILSVFTSANCLYCTSPFMYLSSCFLSQPDNFTDVQKLEMARSLLYSHPVDPANWVGLKKFSPLLENLRVGLALNHTLTAINDVFFYMFDFYVCFCV